MEIIPNDEILQLLRPKTPQSITVLDSTYCLPVNYLYISMLGACPHSCNTSLDADER